MKKQLTMALLLLMTIAVYGQENTTEDQKQDGQNAFIGHHARTYVSKS